MRRKFKITEIAIVLVIVIIIISLKNTECFYGSWKVIDVIGVDPISALSSLETNMLKGRTLKYNKNSFVSGDLVIDKPIYDKTRILDAETNGGQIFKNDIKKLDKASIVNVRVNDSDDKYCFKFGGNFYVLNKNTLVIYYEGVYFEAIKVN